jgi:hypothetical protein
MSASSARSDVLEKVVSDCPSDLLGGLLVDPEVIEIGEFPGFRVWENCCKPINSEMDPTYPALATKHEQHVRRYFRVVLVRRIKESSRAISRCSRTF